MSVTEVSTKAKKVGGNGETFFRTHSYPFVQSGVKDAGKMGENGQMACSILNGRCPVLKLSVMIRW